MIAAQLIGITVSICFICALPVASPGWIRAREVMPKRPGRNARHAPSSRTTLHSISGVTFHGYHTQVRR